MEGGRVINMDAWKKQKAQEQEGAEFPPGFDPVLTMKEHLASLEQDADHYGELLRAATYPGETGIIKRKLDAVNQDIKDTTKMMESGNLSKKAVVEFLKSRKIQHPRQE